MHIPNGIKSTLFIPALGLLLLILIYSTDSNLSIFLFINNISQYTGDNVWAYLTLFGDPFVIVCLALVLINQFPRLALAIIPAVIIGSLLVFPLKHSINTLRPEFVLSALEFHTIGNPPSSPAFPSGHTTGIFVFATLLMLSINKFSFTLLFSFLALIVGSARIVVGAHWPIDICGGIIVGWLSAVIAFHVTKNWRMTSTHRHVLISILLIASIALIFRNTGYTQAQLMQWVVVLLGILTTIKHIVSYRYSAIKTD